MSDTLIPHTSGEVQSPTRVAPTARKLEWFWLLPLGAALCYPWSLRWFNLEFAPAPANVPPALLALLSAHAVPVIGFVCAYRLAREPEPMPRVIFARWFAHLAVGVPSFYTLLGVVLHLIRVTGLDIAVWTALWLALAAFFALQIATAARSAPPIREPQRYAWLRVAHGAAAALILLTFLGPHLFNHLLGIFGDDVHRKVMHAIRIVSRAHIVEPVLIAAFCFMLLSGVTLAKPKNAQPAGFFATLQTTSGVALAFFLASHVNSVFVLARYFGTETDYAWATGEPVGLLNSAWSVRLLPHYSVGVFLLLCHLACGLRVVLLGHRVGRRKANTITFGIIGSGFLVTLVIAAGMIGLRVR
jgi:hypothetical protein